MKLKERESHQGILRTRGRPYITFLAFKGSTVVYIQVSASILVRDSADTKAEGYTKKRGVWSVV
jgi:hypothetical protein